MGKEFWRIPLPENQGAVKHRRRFQWESHYRETMIICNRGSAERHRAGKKQSGACFWRQTRLISCNGVVDDPAQGRRQELLPVIGISAVIHSDGKGGPDTLGPEGARTGLQKERKPTRKLVAEFVRIRAAGSRNVGSLTTSATNPFFRPGPDAAFPRTKAD